MNRFASSLSKKCCSMKLQAKLEFMAKKSLSTHRWTLVDFSFFHTFLSSTSRLRGFGMRAYASLYDASIRLFVALKSVQRVKKCAKNNSSHSGETN